MWTIRGIDPDTRSTAADAADHADLALGTWLDRAILTHGTAFVPAPAHAGKTAHDASASDADDRDVEDVGTDAAGEAGRSAELFADPAVAAALQDALAKVETRLAASEGKIVHLVTPIHARLDSLSLDAVALGAAPQMSGDDLTEDAPRPSPVPPLPQAIARRRLGWIAGVLLAGTLFGTAGMVWLWLAEDKQPPPPRLADDLERAMPAASVPLPPPVASPLGASRDAPPEMEDPVVARLRAEALAGRAEAQHDLALLLAAGRLLPRDDRAAAEWFKKAAMQGLANAQYSLAVIYDSGHGVPADPALAYFWYRAAADQQHREAQYNLGVAYAEGRGVPQDYGDAAIWFRRAAEQDLPEAQYSLGVIHENGLGFAAPDTMTAYAWYRRAAGAGHAAALARMAAIEGRPFHPEQMERPAAAPATVASQPPLAGDHVREIQILLERLDFAVGQPDGRAGPATRAAIRQYQQLAGLDVTGEPSLELLQHLRDVAGLIGP